MAKNTYHFKHDFNAHSDEKIIDLRMDHGMEGYGVYWFIIEALANADSYKLESNYKRIAFSCGSSVDLVKDVIEKYSLFVFDGSIFYSETLINRMERLDEIKLKRAEAGRKGGKVKAIAKQPQANLKQKQAEESKGEESKVNKSKEEVKDSADILAEYLDLWNKSPNTISYNPISSDVKKQLKKKIITREKSIDNFKELLTKVINKPFLDYVSTGKWLTFDWVMKSSGNAEKLLQGVYTDENLYQVNTAEAKRVPKVQSVPKIGDVEVTHKFYDIANTMRTNHIRLPEVINEDVIYEFNANKENFPTGFVDQFMGFYSNQLTGE